MSMEFHLLGKYYRGQPVQVRYKVSQHGESAWYPGVYDRPDHASSGHYVTINTKEGNGPRLAIFPDDDVQP